MKKFRVLSLLLVMCLASSCFVGGTFAKYSSIDSVSDTAIVAKWEIEVEDQDMTQEEWTTFDLFATTEIADTDNSSESDDANVANGTDNGIIAPGTKGSFTIDIDNLSEVAVTCVVSFSATQENLPKDISGNDIEIPIVYALGENPTSWTKEITSLSEEVNLTYAGNTSGQTNGSVTVHWKWAIGDETGTDTALGIAAANATDTSSAPRVTVTAAVRATQDD